MQRDAIEMLAAAKQACARRNDAVQLQTSATAPPGNGGGGRGPLPAQHTKVRHSVVSEELHVQAYSAWQLQLLCSVATCMDDATSAS